MKSTKVKVTNRNFLNFVSAANEYLEDHKDSENRICMVLKRALKKNEKLVDDYNEAIQLLNIENCSADDKGILLRDDKGRYRFTPTAEKVIIEKRKELLNKVVEFEQVISEVVVSDIQSVEQSDFKNIFSPFIYPEINEDEELEKSISLSLEKEAKKKSN